MTVVVTVAVVAAVTVTEGLVIAEQTRFAAAAASVAVLLVPDPS